MGGHTANLTPWRPGQSGNPGGRPKRDAITVALFEQLQSQVADGDTRSIADSIAGTLITLALKGDVRAIREIADRTEGRPRQQLEIEAKVSAANEHVDFSKITDEQLRQVQEILDIAYGVPGLRK